MSPTIFRLPNNELLGVTPARAYRLLEQLRIVREITVHGATTIHEQEPGVFYLTIYNPELADAFQHYLDNPPTKIPYIIVDHVPDPEAASRASDRSAPHQQSRFDPLVQDPVSMPAPMAMPAQAGQDPEAANIHIKVRATLGDMVPLFHRIAAEHPDVDVYCNGTNPGPDGVAWAMFSNPHVCGWFIQMARAQGIEVDDKFHPTVNDRQGKLHLVPPPALGGFSPYGTPQRQPEPQGAGGTGGGGGFGRDRVKGWAARLPRRR